MIIFTNNINDEPYKLYREVYKNALIHKQKDIQAVSISSYSSKNKEVDSRFVNLKEIDGRNFIFYSNYNSPKAIQFYEHPQISAIFYWNIINTQIRIKANIEKLSALKSDIHFKNRSLKKNAIAISSSQSKIIHSYEMVKKNYLKVLNEENLIQRPSYWGGFSFIPYYFEFWEGDESRINKRLVYKKIDKKWEKLIIQP